MPDDHEATDPVRQSVRPGRDGYVAGRDMTVHVHQGGSGQGQDERAIRARSERAAAFAELWKIAQDAHIGVRNNFGMADELGDVQRKINILLIERAPALEESDVELARNFLNALGEFIRLLRPLPGESAEQLREEIALTASGPPMLKEFAILEESHSRMVLYNDLLTRRYRELVYGEPAG
jgi:hypothetical protein